MESSIVDTKGASKRKRNSKGIRSGRHQHMSDSVKQPCKTSAASEIGSRPEFPNKRASLQIQEKDGLLSDGDDSDSSENKTGSGSAVRPFGEAGDDPLQQHAIDGATKDQSTTAANGSARRSGDTKGAAVNGDLVGPVHSSLQEQLDNSERENQRLQAVIEQLHERPNLATKQHHGETTDSHHTSRSEVEIQRLQEINKQLEEQLDSRAHELYKSDCEVERLQNANKQLDDRLDILSKRDAEKWAKYELVDPKVELQNLQTRYTILQKELDLAKRRINHESKQGWATTAENEFRLMNRNFKQLQWNLDRSKAQHRQEATFADRLIGIISGEGVDSEVYRQASIDFPQHFPEKGKATSNLFFPAPENIASQDALEPWFRTKARIPQKTAESTVDSGDVYCYCKRPESDDMVQCDGECEEWFHYQCVGFDETSSDEKWFCDECQKKKAENADEAEYDDKLVEYEEDDDGEYVDED